MIDSVSSQSFASYGQRPSASKARTDPAAPEGETNEPKTKKKGPTELSESEKEQVKKLKERDLEVRAHEMAHLAAAGSLARGGPTYVYQTGPDGKSYAVGGSVKIDTSPGRTPEETARKAAQIRAAALAPSEPSSADLQVAAQASSMAASSKGATNSLPDPSAKEPSSESTPKPASDAISTSRRIEPTASKDSAQNDPSGHHPHRDRSAQTYANALAKAYGSASRSTGSPP